MLYLQHTTHIGIVKGNGEYIVDDMRTVPVGVRTCYDRTLCHGSRSPTYGDYEPSIGQQPTAGVGSMLMDARYTIDDGSGSGC